MLYPCGKWLTHELWKGLRLRHRLGQPILAQRCCYHALVQRCRSTRAHPSSQLHTHTRILMMHVNRTNGSRRMRLHPLSESAAKSIFYFMYKTHARTRANAHKRGQTNKELNTLSRPHKFHRSQRASAHTNTKIYFNCCPRNNEIP